MMTSYMKLFEDFLQRKECDGTRIALAASEDEDMEVTIFVIILLSKERKNSTSIVKYGWDHSLFRFIVNCLFVCRYNGK